MYYMDMKHSDAIVYYGYSWETKVENEGENPKKFHRSGNEKVSPSLGKLRTTLPCGAHYLHERKRTIRTAATAFEKKEQRMALRLNLLAFGMDHCRSKRNVKCRYASTVFSCTTYAKDVVDGNIQKDLLTFRTFKYFLTHKRKLYVPVLPPLISGTESHIKKLTRAKMEKMQENTSSPKCSGYSSSPRCYGRMGPLRMGGKRQGKLR